MKLKRTIQCAKCPWKKSTNPREIPGGYCEVKHRKLKSTISEPGRLSFGPLEVMACHHSQPGKEEHCIGWLINQLGVGNNIALRMSVRKIENISEIRVIGDQHQRFEDTLPR